MIRRFMQPTYVMSAGYWWYYVALGCSWPYLTLYYNQLGLTGSQIGVLAAVQPLATAFLAPLWGMLADRFGIHRMVLCSSILCAAIIVMLLAQVTTFGPILVLIMLLAILAAPMTSLIDSYGVTISERYGAAFGQIRVWGSAGYSISAVLIGWFMGGTVTAFFLGAYAVTLLLTFGTMLGLPPIKIRSRQQMWHGTADLLRRPAILVLLLTTYLSAIGTSVLFNFLSIHMSNLGGTSGLVGMANSIGAISELPVLFFGGWLAARLGGRRMLMVALLAYSIRYLLISLVPSAGWILPLQLLHGPSFGLFLMASITLVHQLAGADHAATAQGLLASSFALGMISGSLAGGALLDHIGLERLFQMVGAVVLLALAICAFGSNHFKVEPKPTFPEPLMAPPTSA